MSLSVFQRPLNGLYGFPAFFKGAPTQCCSKLINQNYTLFIPVSPTIFVGRNLPFSHREELSVERYFIVCVRSQGFFTKSKLMVNRQESV